MSILNNSVKYLLSYLTDITIDKANSPLSGDVFLSLSNGRYQLSTTNAIYSNEDRYVTFREAFRQLKIEQNEISSCLILGFGLGSIPLLLNKNHKQTPLITGIEIDPNIIKWAKQYGYTDNVNLIEADAYDYCLTDKSTYDLICVDIFIDDLVPQTFEKAEFLKAVKERLSEKGLLLFNRLYHTKDLASKTNSFFNYTFSQIFNGAYILITGGNRMLVYQSKTKQDK